MKHIYTHTEKQRFDLNIVLRVVVSDSLVAFVKWAELFGEFLHVIGNCKTKKDWTFGCFSNTIPFLLSAKRVQEAAHLWADRTKIKTG